MGRVVWGAALVACCAFVGACWGVWWVADTLSEAAGWRP